MRIYIVKNGEMFYGTLEQFEDTFGGSGGDEDSMRKQIEDMGYTFVALDGDLIDFQSMSIKESRRAILGQIAMSER